MADLPHVEITLGPGRVAVARIPQVADLDRLGDARKGCATQDEWAVSLVKEIDGAAPVFADMSAADTSTIAYCLSEFWPDQDAIGAALATQDEADDGGRCFTVPVAGVDRVVSFRRPTNADVLEAKKAGGGRLWSEGLAVLRRCCLSIDGEAMTYQRCRTAWPFDLFVSVILIECVQSLRAPTILDAEAAKGSMRVI